MTRTTADRPYTLDGVAAALDAASCDQVERGADLIDDARRSLRAIAATFDRALHRLADSWQGDGADAAWPGGDVTMSRLGEPLRRTRELLHHLDESEYGQHLRRTAGTLAAGQARVRELRAQRAADPTGHGGYDERAQLVLHDVARAYQDIGRALGGTGAPPLAPVDEPPLGTGLHRSARDGDDTLRLASGTDVDVELFRPVGQVPGAGLTGEPVLPPSGGGGGGGGMPMMPMPMGGMGGMGGVGAAQQESTTQQRRTASALQGDQGAWGSQDEGWNVLGRQKQIAKAQEDVRLGLDREFGKFLKGDRDG